MKRLITTTFLLIALAVSPLSSLNFAQAAEIKSGCPVYHTVQIGENLFRIGLKYGLSWTAIASANGLANANAISVGQVLCIPVVRPAVTLGPTKTAAPSPTPTAAIATGSGGGDSPTPTATPQPVVAASVPTFSIMSVVKDTTVTINAVNFPANTTFNVLLGAYGTLGVGGAQVGTQNSGSGAFTASYTIPANLKGSPQIAIRLQSPNGYFSYNWFFNNR